MSSQALFSIPVVHTKGSFTCTSPADRIYLLTFTSPPDNRLHSNFIDAFLLSLDIIEEKYPKGVVITTSSIAKFYSNGLDIEHVLSTPDFWETKMNKICARLLTYPMPTIALLNGHTFAGGFFIAMFHDYRIQNPSKGFVCLNEIDIGMVIPTAVLSIFREKVSNAGTYRSAVLEGKRFPGPEALKEGLVDALGGLDEALKFVKERNLIAKASGPWGGMKDDMYRDTLGYLRDSKGTAQWRVDIEAVKDAQGEQREKRVAEFEKLNKLAKL